MKKIFMSGNSAEKDSEYLEQEIKKDEAEKKKLKLVLSNMGI